MMRLHIGTAVMAANESSCVKSKRGAVIFKDLESISLGFNSPPPGFSCTGSNLCQSNCNKVAVHAEERAILAAERDLLIGADLIHAKTVAGELVESGPPSCWQCSRMIVEAVIAGVWLYGIGGWCRWTTKEFHRDTLQNCGLSEARPPR